LRVAKQILQGWNEIKPPQPWQINGSSDHLTTCRTCRTPGFNSRLKYDDRITRNYYT
jgi:hypothetical protein